MDSGLEFESLNSFSVMKFLTSEFQDVGQGDPWSEIAEQPLRIQMGYFSERGIIHVENYRANIKPRKTL